jgi:multidrug efflux system membrane fusion protein
MLLAGALILASVVSGCSDPAGGKESRPAGPPPVPVVVGTAIEKPMPTQIRAIGTAQAISTIQVKPQISGQLMTVHFREGQDVQKGDLLFTIDRRPLEAALQQAEANLLQARAQLRQAEAAVVRDRAQLENARVEDVRYAKLAEQGYVAREQADQIHTSLQAMGATVDADQAAVENAKAFIVADQAAVDSARIQLDYAEVHSPIDGRTGNLMVQPGNLVKANDVPVLVTIAQTRPIYVAFGVPERSLPEIRQHMANGPLDVEVQPQGGGTPARGRVTFVDNAVDATTGTIQLKATVPNVDGALWPGQFASVLLTLTVDPRAVVVPSPAVQTGQNGQYVFVVKSDDTVEVRPIVVRATQGTDTVVDRGVQPGERVVTDGQLRLVPGSRVEIRTAPAAPGNAPSVTPALDPSGTPKMPGTPKTPGTKVGA